jgi:anti-anti-sigma factor
MMPALTWTVDNREVVTTVVVRGDLRTSDTPALHRTLLECLAEQPEVLLLDLSQVSLIDTAALTVFTAVARQAARWPGTPVLVCAPRPEMEAVLRRRPTRWLSVHPSVSAGLGAYRAGLSTYGAGRAVSAAITDQLLPVTGAPRHARNRVTEACATWGLDALVGPACLIADELVSNAVERAGTMMTLVISRRFRYLHLAVRDGSSEQPRLRPPGPVTSPLRGRGLMLVDALSAHWGWLPSADGKIVWATLALKP